MKNSWYGLALGLLALSLVQFSRAQEQDAPRQKAGDPVELLRPRGRPSPPVKAEADGAGKEEKPAPPADPVKNDEALLEKAGLKTDGQALLEFFKRRTLPEEDRAKIEALIHQLNSPTFRERSQAAQLLVQRGPVVLELLREAAKTADLETRRRLELSIFRIREQDVPAEVPSAAARLLGHRKPKNTIETLLAYIPFADNDNVAEETRVVLGQLALAEGKAHPALAAGLKDPQPIRRAAAGEALARAGSQEHQAAVRDLLKDPSPIVRLRVAIALAHAREMAAVETLVELLPDVPLNLAWQAEDVLFRLADGKSPPALSLGNTPETRNKARDAWRVWWKKHAAEIDLARLHEIPRLLNYTTVVLLDLGKVLEMDAQKQVRWQVENLIFPLDVQVLPGDRLLVAEYHGQRVSERNTKTGEILWQKRVPGPLVAQRMANGNTFIATDTLLLEVDREDREVLSIPMPEGEKTMKAMKLPNGEIVCLTTEPRILRLDSTGKELQSYPIPLTMRLFGGRIHALPNGRVLIPLHQENKVVEYDSQGKVVWELEVRQPVAATRLPNGNTLVTTMDPATGAIEFDRQGNSVWSYRSDTRVTRALRR